jgi:hypothetical protein
MDLIVVALDSPTSVDVGGAMDFSATAAAFGLLRDDSSFRDVALTDAMLGGIVARTSMPSSLTSSPGTLFVHCSYAVAWWAGFAPATGLRVRRRENDCRASGR